MSKQFDTLGDKIRERGGMMQCMSQAKLDSGAKIEIWLVYRKEKPPVRVIVIDTAEDGYQLFFEAPGNKIDDDVEALFSHGAQS